MPEEKNPRSVGVHDGAFHADEVTACALLLLFDLVDRDKVIRTRDPKKLERCAYICDVGGIYDPSKKLFDHHQSDYRGLLSSAGMILLYLKEEKIISEDAYLLFNNTLVYGVDLHDNGRPPEVPGTCTFSHIISNYNPVEYNAASAEQDKAFSAALDFTYSHIKRGWNRFNSIGLHRDCVAERMQKDKDYLIFDEAVPWMENFFALGGEDHPAAFVIMPSNQGWKLRGIPPTYRDRMSVRVPLPKKWAGLLDEDLKKVSGISGAIFCHKGRFISVWETLDDAMEAYHKTLKIACESKGRKK